MDLTSIVPRRGESRRRLVSAIRRAAGIRRAMYSYKRAGDTVYIYIQDVDARERGERHSVVVAARRVDENGVGIWVVDYAVECWRRPIAPSH